jgi:fimbrial chaperone protein
MNNSVMKLKAIFAGLLLCSATTAWAGSIEITPVRISLSDASKAGVLTVRNTGASESVVQVTLNKWTLNGQDYAYAQSQELVITPVTFRLAPGGQQIVRVGLRGGAPANNELAYRLLVEEVPPPLTPGVTGALLVVRHDLPVFVAPRDKAKITLHMDQHCQASGAQLHIANTGNLHNQLRSVALTDPDTKKELAHWEAFDYLLPTAEKTWMLAQVAPAAVGKKFVITLLTDQGAFTADATQPCP